MVQVKGQGATEYLILFAVVLIVALVAVALLGFFPGVGANAKSSGTSAYWSSVRPVQIDTWSSSNTTLSLVLKSANANSVLISTVTISNASTMTTTDSASPAVTLLNPGDTTATTVTTTNNHCVTGSPYAYYVKISYTVESSAQNFTGTKPIIGTCG